MLSGLLLVEGLRRETRRRRLEVSSQAKWSSDVVPPAEQQKYQPQTIEEQNTENRRGAEGKAHEKRRRSQLVLSIFARAKIAQWMLDGSEMNGTAKTASQTAANYTRFFCGSGNPNIVLLLRL